MAASNSDGLAAATSGPPQPARWRTEDVQAEKTFSDLGLPSTMVAALASCGYERPSPVQQAAIPLGRLGSDLIVQAKSGTGKTVVFATICLERVKLQDNHAQALIVAPTREIAIQSEQVISRLAGALSDPPAVTCAVFVGGINIAQDEKRLRRLLHVVVGTPGRLTALIQNESLKCEHITMFVLDEADALLGDSHYSDVSWIYEQLPRKKQVMAFSATYTPELLADLEPLMKRPQRVMLCEETVSLKGVRQFYQLLEVPGAGAETGVAGLLLEAKVAALLKLLRSCSFYQASVFCNDKPQAEWLARRLSAACFPAVYLGADLAQEERQRIMQDVRGFKTRVVVSTDVLARGVDLERINLVLNMDLPRDAATYVHRVGRTGRFGTLGVAVCMVTPPELAKLQAFMQEAAAGEVEPLPDPLPADLYRFELGSEWEKQALQALQQAPEQEAPPPPGATAAPGTTSNGDAAQPAKAGKRKKKEHAAGQADSQGAAADGAGTTGDAAALQAQWDNYWQACYDSYYQHGAYGNGYVDPYSTYYAGYGSPWQGPAHGSSTSSWYGSGAQDGRHYGHYGHYGQQYMDAHAAAQWPGAYSQAHGSQEASAAAAAVPQSAPHPQAGSAQQQQAGVAAAAPAAVSLPPHPGHQHTHPHQHHQQQRHHPSAEPPGSSGSESDSEAESESDSEVDVPGSDTELDAHATGLLAGLQVLMTEPPAQHSQAAQGQQDAAASSTAAAAAAGAAPQGGAGSKHGVSQPHSAPPAQQPQQAQPSQGWQQPAPGAAWPPAGGTNPPGRQWHQQQQHYGYGPYDMYNDWYSQWYAHPGQGAWGSSSIYGAPSSAWQAPCPHQLCPSCQLAEYCRQREAWQQQYAAWQQAFSEWQRRQQA